MSTAPTVPVTPAAPVAPTPATEVNVNMTREQIAAATPTPVAPVTPAAAPIPAATAPTPENPVVTTDLGNGQFEVKYLTGETFKGTATEILQKQGQAHVNTKNWARNQVQPTTPPAPPVPPPSKFSTPEEEATAKYVTDLQAKFLGFNSAEEYQQALGRVQQNTDQFAGQNLSIQFAASAPEFNATQENSDKLLNTIDSLGLTQQFVAGDTPQQLKILQAAHAYALHMKVYDAKPVATNIPTPPVPPPPIPTSGPTDLTTIPEDLRVDQNMSKEEIMRRIDLAKSRNYIY
jgi:hypothetical protein